MMRHAHHHRSAPYRALLWAILERGHTPAYRHGAAHWVKLSQLAGRLNDDALSETAEAFAARVRAKHGRKPSFWAAVAAAEGAARRATPR